MIKTITGSIWGYEGEIIMNIDEQWVRANYKGEEFFTIPDGVTSIGDFAFKLCESLKSITIPDSVTSIYSWAFSGCKSLESITIPDGVTSIADNTFIDCESLESITIPDSVTKIGYQAFSDCKSLKNITIPNGVTSIDKRAFSDCTSLESITIPDSVTKIGDYAFWNCKSLKSISIPDSVMSIGEEAFCSCESLESITIPDEVVSIGEEAFYGCKTIITYKKREYPSYLFSDENTFPFIKVPSYENLMKIEEVPIKARLSLDYIESGEQFVEYVRENCVVLIKQSMENKDWDALDKIFNSEHKLLRPKQLDECLEFTIENNYHELSVLLMHYKEQRTDMYDKDDNRFKLEL